VFPQRQNEVTICDHVHIAMHCWLGMSGILYPECFTGAQSKCPTWD